jgi:hypothetical protein
MLFLISPGLAAITARFVVTLERSFKKITEISFNLPLAISATLRLWFQTRASKKVFPCVGSPGKNAVPPPGRQMLSPRWLENNGNEKFFAPFGITAN